MHCEDGDALYFVRSPTILKRAFVELRIKCTVGTETPSTLYAVRRF